MKELNLEFRRNPYITDEEIKNAAVVVNNSGDWELVEDACDTLMRAAGIDWVSVHEEYKDVDDGSLFERTIDAVADFLKVKI